MKRLLRLLSAAIMTMTLLVVLGGAGLLYLVNNYDGGLPDHRQLADYEPPMATRIHAGDGRLLAEYARQNRTYVPIEAIPERVK
ncbi:MAG: penicillin-binding protein, partial [Geminicoccaceae bacterium]